MAVIAFAQHDGQSAEFVTGRTNALVAAKESEYPKKPYFIANQELIRTPDYYEESGADGYITSESYLTEKRVDGGEV